MRYLRHENGHLLFRLLASERNVLSRMLKLYPVMPPGHARVTQTAALDPDGERQQLLDEALGSLRRENQRRIEVFLNSDRRFETQDKHIVLRLTESEADWLLEVLNEIHVGSWVRLGSPQPGTEVGLPLQPESLRYLWAMEMSGRLESRLLDGLNSLS